MTDRHERNYSDENATNKDDRNAQRPLSGAGFFEIRVLGHLDDEWSDWFEGLDIKLLENGEMVLSGVIVDQSALMGILNKLHRLNLPLLSVSQGSKKIDVKEGEKMDNAQKLNQKFEAIGWGAFFIWWGVTELFPSLPDGMGTLGIGVILLGLNAARSFYRVPTSGFTTALGILALLLGGAELARLALRLQFELPVFAMFLIVIGTIFLIRELAGSRNT